MVKYLLLRSCVHVILSTLPVVWHQDLLQQFCRLIGDLYRRCLLQLQQQLQASIQPDPVADLLGHLTAYRGHHPGLLHQLVHLRDGLAGLVGIWGLLPRPQPPDGAAQGGEGAVQNRLDVGADARGDRSVVAAGAAPASLQPADIIRDCESFRAEHDGVMSVESPQEERHRKEHLPAESGCLQASRSSSTLSHLCGSAVNHPWQLSARCISSLPCHPCSKHINTRKKVLSRCCFVSVVPPPGSQSACGGVLKEATCQHTGWDTTHFCCLHRDKEGLFLYTVFMWSGSLLRKTLHQTPLSTLGPHIYSILQSASAGSLSVSSRVSAPPTGSGYCRWWTGKEAALLLLLLLPPLLLHHSRAEHAHRVHKHCRPSAGGGGEQPQNFTTSVT